MTDSYKTPAAFALSVVAFDALSLGLVLPVLPNLVAEISHGSPSQTAFYVGALFAIYSFMQFLFSPVIGGLSDQFGRRPVLLISLLGLGLNTLLWVWVGNIGLLFGLRICSGLFASNVSTASAYIADITPQDKRTHYFGLIGAMYGIGFILGPVFGGIMAHFWLRLPFLVAAGLIVCNALYGFFVLPESLPPEKRHTFEWRRANPFNSLNALGKGPGQKLLTFVWCCMWLTVAAHQSSFILANEMRFGWSELHNGLVLGVGGVFQVVVMAGLVPQGSKRWGDKWTAVVGFVFSMFAYLMFAFAPAGWVIYAALPVLALGMLSVPTMQSMLSAGAGEARKGEIQGALTSLQALMLAVGPLVMGSLFSASTRSNQSFQFPGVAFFAAAIISIIAAFVLSRLNKADGVAAPEDALPAYVSAQTLEG